ncbi:MAG: hypothetical protein KDJ80_14845 [Nitratireductor sp.]|nr:hypothetical protein [Nitratireductor sp.]
MNTFKKTVFAVATVSTLAVATAPAHAGNPWWGKPFVKGLGMGVGMGVGLGVTNAILSPKPQTVIVQQPQYCQQVAVYNAYGQFLGYQPKCY